MKKTYLVLVLVFLAAAFSAAALDLVDITIEATEGCGGGTSGNGMSVFHKGQSFIANHTGVIKKAEIPYYLNSCNASLGINRTICWGIKDYNWSSSGNTIGSGCSQIECRNESAGWEGNWQTVDINANISKGTKYYLYQLNRTQMHPYENYWFVWKLACPSLYPDLESLTYLEAFDGQPSNEYSSVVFDLQVNFTTSVLDTDGDLIADEDDVCPVVFGLPQLNGCPDLESPVINLTGDNPQTIGVGTYYVELGAVSLDNIDGDLSANISINIGEVNTSIVGNYLVYYSSNDSAGNFAIINRTINVTDSESPIITLIGSNTQSIEYLNPYVELGAIATDNVDGNISGNIIIDSSAVNTGIFGNYNVTYNVNDSNGNNAEQKTRTVNAVDTTTPVISLIGNGTINLEVNSSYVDVGATASDNYDGDLTASIVTINPVDVNIVGSYLITYNVKDSSDNAAAQVSRTINVVDTQVPVINLVGGQIVNLTLGENYTDSGAIAIDNYDGNITTNIIMVNPVNINLAGQYLITYNAKDSNNNDAVQVTRTVNVLTAPDTTAPAINVISPLDQNYENKIIVNISITDDNLDYFNITLDGVDYKHITVFEIELSLGVHMMSVYANDTFGNEGYAGVYLFTVVDLTAPTLTLSYSSGILKALTNENSTCYYNTTTTNLTLINENATTENQVTLNLPYGNYWYYAECFDASSNKANSTLNIILNAPPENPSNSGGGSGGGSSSGGDFSLPPTASNKANIIISEINPGEQKSIKINNNEITIKEIHIEVNNQVKNIDITIRKEEGQPASVTKATTENNEEIYQYLSIDHPHLENENIKNAEISFEVDKKWLKDKNIDENSVSLNRFSEGKWQKLNTHKATVNVDKITYTAETPGFSIFAVTGENKDKEIINTTIIEESINEVIITSSSEMSQKEPIGKNTITSQAIRPLEKKNPLMAFIIISIIAVICIGIFAYKKFKK